MSLTNPDKLITEQDLNDFYTKILPYLGADYKEVSGTLTAGQTSITLSDASITANSTIDIYTDADVEYVSATPGTGSITITFEEQQSNLGVKVRVS